MRFRKKSGVETLVVGISILNTACRAEMVTGILALMHILAVAMAVVGRSDRVKRRCVECLIITCVFGVTVYDLGEIDGLGGGWN